MSRTGYWKLKFLPEELHGKRQYPQFLHHCPHRPRQIHPGRPYSGADQELWTSATMEDQLLDNMDMERERGITIKARAVTMNYHRQGRQDLRVQPHRHPGPRGLCLRGLAAVLAACEGAILVVDATQGVEAQTLANTYLALEHDLETGARPQQDRPAQRRSGQGGAGGGGRDRPALSGRAPRLRQDGPEYRSGAGACRHRHPCSRRATRTLR